MKKKLLIMLIIVCMIGFTLGCSDATIVKIEISQNPTITSFVGEDLVISGGKIKVSFSDSKSEEIDMTAEMISGFDKAVKGEQTLTVTYEGKTATFNGAAKVVEVATADSFNTAVVNASDGQYIVVNSEITITEMIVSKKTITIDLNGKTIHANVEDGRGLSVEGGKLTLINGTIDSNGAGTTAANATGAWGTMKVDKTGELVAENLTLKNSRPYGLNIKLIGAQAKATLRNVTINSIYGGGIEVSQGTADLYSCTFTQKSYCDHCSSNVSVSGGGTVNVHSGTYTSENFGACIFSSGGTMELYGGTFEAKTALRADWDKGTYPNGKLKIVMKGDVSLKGKWTVSYAQMILDEKAMTAYEAAKLVEGNVFKEVTVEEYIQPTV